MKANIESRGGTGNGRYEHDLNARIFDDILSTVQFPSYQNVMVSNSASVNANDILTFLISFNFNRKQCVDCQIRLI